MGIPGRLIQRREGDLVGGGGVGSKSLLKPWPGADAPTTSRGPLPPTFLLDGGVPPLLPGALASPATCTGLTTHCCLWARPYSLWLWLDTTVTFYDYYRGPHQRDSLALHFAAQTLAWLPDLLPYGPLSAWDLNPVTWNPIHLWPTLLHLPPRLQAQSTALVLIAYLLVSSLSDKLPLLARPGQSRGIRKSEAAAWQEGQEGGSCPSNSPSS